MDRRAEVWELAREMQDAVDGWLVWDPVAVGRYLRKVRSRLNHVLKDLEQVEESEKLGDGTGGTV